MNWIQRRLLKPLLERHSGDDVETARRRLKDRETATAEGVDPAEFWLFRIFHHRWGGPNDGADRYPEHL